jgi:hypothetical protein
MNTTSCSAGKSGGGGKGPVAPAERKPVVPRDGVPALRLEGTDRDTRRWAAAILEVLAGVRTPRAAAQALDISLPRYYMVELRALQGLVAACAPRPRGQVRTAASELAALRRECERLRRDGARHQALARVAQRAVGLAPPATSPPKPAGGKKRRPRRPTARALKAVQVLREEEPTAAAAGGETAESDRGVSSQ